MRIITEFIFETLVEFIVNFLMTGTYSPIKFLFGLITKFKLLRIFSWTLSGMIFFVIIASDFSKIISSIFKTPVDTKSLPITAILLGVIVGFTFGLVDCYRVSR